MDINSGFLCLAENDRIMDSFVKLLNDKVEAKSKNRLYYFAIIFKKYIILKLIQIN